MSSRSKKPKDSESLIPGKETGEIQEGKDPKGPLPGEETGEIQEIKEVEKTKPPESPGRVVYVSGSKFSHPFRVQAAKDFQAGLVKDAMQIQLPDGQIITAGPTYETHISADLLQLIKIGVLQASNFGKLAKRGALRV